METIFKSALNHIQAEEQLKKRTEVYIMENMIPKIISLRNPFMKRFIAVACTAVFLCGTSIGAFAYYKTPTSYLSLDINPSVELGVNSFDKVVSSTAYNNDGKTILVGQDVIGSSVKDAVSTLVKSAALKGFIAKDGSTIIAVTSETDNSSNATNLQNSATLGADAAIKFECDKATVQKENVALSMRAAAQKLGITPGKLNLIQKLQAFDPKITVDQYKNAKVTDIMKKYVELKKESLSQKGENKNLRNSSSAVSSSSHMNSSCTVSSANESSCTEDQNSKSNVAQSSKFSQQKSSSTSSMTTDKALSDKASCESASSSQGSSKNFR
jgi:hypothetical protein